MAQQILSGFPSSLRNRGSVFLAFFWVSGLAAGILFYMHVHDVLSLLMRGIPFAPVSIVGLLFAALLPFLLSAFAVFYHTILWIFPLAAGKAFLLAFVSIGIRDIAGDAGWLLQTLFLLSDVLTVPLLYLYWLRSLAGERYAFLWLLPCLPLVLSWVVCANSHVILPVFAELGNR